MSQKPIDSIMDNMSSSSSSTFNTYYSRSFVHGNNSAILGGHEPHSQELSEALLIVNTFVTESSHKRYVVPKMELYAKHEGVFGKEYRL